MEGRERTAQLELMNRALEAEIAAHRAAAVVLRGSEERFRTLVESLPHLIWTCRPDGSCDYLNRQWTEYTGRSAESQLGDGWMEQVHPDDRERVCTQWAAAMVRGDRFDIEFRIRRGDGEYRWFETRTIPLRDAAGRILKWLGSYTDIEAPRRAQYRAATQLERLGLLNRITRAIGERQDLNSILRVVICNLEDHLPIDFGCVCSYEATQESVTVTCVGERSEPLAAEIAMSQGARVDIDRNGLSGGLRGQLVHEPDLGRTDVPFLQRLARGGLHSLVIAPLLVDSNVFGVLVAARREAHSFSSGDCEFIGQLCEHVALAAHQAQIYAALQQAYDELRQTTRTVLQQERLRALGQMASGIAHDINNTISPIALYTESLLEHESGLTERAREYLQTIQRAIVDVEQTIARVREFYRPHEAQSGWARVDLNGLVQQVVDLTRARWSDLPQQRGIVILVQTELAADLPTIRGADHEIRDALINLVFNAVDAMPEGGTLTLRTAVVFPNPSDGTQGPLGVRVEVRDTGLGMNEETRRRCVEPFFTTKGERGTGLGLASVYGMTQRHGGSLQIDSEPGNGTSILLVFPTSDTDPAPSDQRHVPPAPMRSQRILIVDDDPLIIESLRNTLRSEGHFVTTADGGQAGIDSFMAAGKLGEPFSVVITDLGMPYVDGRKVAAAIRAASPSTPIILLTGWGRRLISESDVPSGVDRVLSKPPRLRDLRAALAEVTERSAR